MLHLILKVLDIGYGSGSFLYSCLKFFNKAKIYGFDVSDYELDPPVIRIKNDELSNYYGVVTMWDSLEHIPDLSFLKNLNCY